MGGSAAVREGGVSRQFSDGFMNPLETLWARKLNSKSLKIFEDVDH